MKRANRAQVVNATHSRSELWRHFKVFFLTENMRINTSRCDATDARWYDNLLLRLGDGAEDVHDEGGHDDCVQLPERLCLPDRATEALIDFTFPSLRDRHSDSQWIGERAILAPLNNDADNINDDILENYMPGDVMTLYSDDQLEPGENIGAQPPVEYLNTLKEGMPPMSYI